MSAQAFASGNDFLACERSDDNNCVILDVHMPGMGGLELAKRLIDDEPELPVILITGREDDGARIAARHVGAMSFFRKPFNDQEFIDAIESALRSRVRREGG